MAISLEPGSPVRIQHLKSRPELNGVQATIGSFDSLKGRWAVEVPDGSRLLLKPENLIALPVADDDAAADDDDALELQDNLDDLDGDDDDLMLEVNADDDDDDGGLMLEENVDTDDDDDDGLMLEENMDPNESDHELMLEENAVDDSDGSLTLEGNLDDGSDDEDGPTLEDDDGTLYEDGPVLEVEEEVDAGPTLEGEETLLESTHGRAGEPQVEEISTDELRAASGATRSASVPLGNSGAPFFAGGGSFGDRFDGGVPTGGGMPGGARGSVPAGLEAGDTLGGIGAGGIGSGGLAEALQALSPGSASKAHLGIGKDGRPVDPERFLIPSAKAALEQALALHAPRPGESERDRVIRVLQILTADKGQEVFDDAARQILEAYGEESIAERMRNIGDDHFAAGSYSAASYAYTAGIERHTESGDDAQLMHTYVNRSAAYLKLGETQRALEDADRALALAEGTFAPKTQRKALLRRAQALFEQGKLDAAKSDLEQLGPSDPGASKLLQRIGGDRDGKLV